VIGTTLQIVRDAGNLKACERLLDAATGNGNATLAAHAHYPEGPPSGVANAALRPSIAYFAVRPRRVAETASRSENWRRWSKIGASGTTAHASLKVADGHAPVTIADTALVHIVDDDKSVRESLGALLRSMGYQVALYGSAAEFVKVDLPNVPACLVLEVRLPGLSGLELQEYLTRVNIRLPVIFITGFGDIPIAVRAMKAGAIDFFTKPIRDQDLLDTVAAAIRLDQSNRHEVAQISELRNRYTLLTPRERQVVALVTSGLMNKQVAHELSISEVTVKLHRSSAVRKLGEKSVARLARIVHVLDRE
jgi:FixJ family two-component response regulator